ncbi:MAG: hypothetical protein ACN6PK_01660 [Pseudomonas shirazensis]
MLAPAAFAASNDPRLELRSAMLMADAAQQAAVAQGYNIVISVHDQHGNLKYLRRDAGAGQRFCRRWSAGLPGARARVKPAPAWSRATAQPCAVRV